MARKEHKTPFNKNPNLLNKNLLFINIYQLHTNTYSKRTAWLCLNFIFSCFTVAKAVA